MPDVAGAKGARGMDAVELGDSLRELIRSSGVQPGSRIGAEREIAERFGTGRWTVRRALEGLEHEGLVTRMSGRSGGVFVAHKPVVRDLTRMVSLATILQSHGLTSEGTILSTATVQADETLATDLELAIGDWVYEVNRLRFAEGDPLSVEKVLLPVALFPGLLDHSLTGSIYDVLEAEYGLVRGDADESIRAAPADLHTASLLRVPPGFPLLDVTRRARTVEGVVFELSKDHYRGDRVSVTVHVEGQDRHVRTTT